MSARDDELVERYREASAQETARPGAQVRDAVRAHAQMLAAAPLPASPAPRQAAANQSHWKISALATVAVVGLTGLLLLQFQRGTPEEQEIAYGQRRAAPSAGVQAPAAPPPAPAATPAAPQAALPEPAAPAPLQRSTHQETSPPAKPQAQKPAAPVPGATTPLAKTAPAPATQEAEAPPAPGRADAVSGFPASPPYAADAPSGPSAAAPSVSSAPAPRAEMRERLANQDAAAAKSLAPPPPAAAAAGAATPEPARPAAQAEQGAGSGLRGGIAADNRLAAAAPRADSGRGNIALPDGLREAARAGQTPEVERLIAQGAPVDARDSAGRTALMLAAANGQTTTVHKLLALGANPALLDHEGLNAAQQARRLGHRRTAELIEAGS